MANVEISAQIKNILDRNNVQCRSLAALPEGLFELFLARRRPAVVLLRGRPVRAVVRRGIDEETFEMEAPELVPHLKAGDLVLVVFPGPDGRRYVVQARVAAVFADGFRGECMDPRYSDRLCPEGEVVVSWRRVPDDVELALRGGELRVFRNMDDGVVEKAAPDETDQREPPGFEGKREFAVLADISCGGAALASRGRVDGGIVDHLLYLETEKSAAARAGLFGVVRGVSDGGRGSVIHVMFVARIPEDAAAAIAGRNRGGGDG